MLDYLNNLFFGLDTEQVSFFESLICSYNIKKALDLACGNGDLGMRNMPILFLKAV